MDPFRAPEMSSKWTPRRAGFEPKPFEFIVFPLIRPPRKGSILVTFGSHFGNHFLAGASTGLHSLKESSLMLLFN